MISEIVKASKNALSIVTANISGTSAIKMTYLRKLCNNKNVFIKVVRNTLLKHIIPKTQFKYFKNNFIGPTIIAFSYKNAGTAARILKKFTIKNKNIKIKESAFEGKILLNSQINILVKLPTYKEIIYYFIYIIEEISIKKIINTIKLIINKNKK